MNIQLDVVYTDMVDFCRLGHNYGIWYCSNVTSHTLKIFVESQAHVEQTYFSSLMPRRSLNRSHNTKVVPQYITIVVKKFNIILFEDFFSLKFLFLSLLDAQHNTREENNGHNSLRKSDIFNLKIFLLVT